MQQNLLAAWRGGLVCPSGCECTHLSVCGIPLMPPTPTPTPPAPASKECKWFSDTALIGNDFKMASVESKEVCCGLCHSTEGCVAADFNPEQRRCHLKDSNATAWRNDGSIACIPHSAI